METSVILSIYTKNDTLLIMIPQEFCQCKPIRRCLSPIQDRLFRGCSRMGVGEGGQKVPLPPFPKIYYVYPAMMKLSTVIPYLKKIQKMYESRDAPL